MSFEQPTNPEETQETMPTPEVPAEDERQEVRYEGYEPSTSEKVAKGLLSLGAGAALTLFKIKQLEWQRELELGKGKPEEEVNRDMAGRVEKDLGSPFGYFARKTIDAYQATDKIDDVLGENHFNNISGEYEEKIETASGEEEKRRAEAELAELRKQREKFVEKTQQKKKLRSTIFGIAADLLK